MNCSFRLRLACVSILFFSCGCKSLQGGKYNRFQKVSFEALAGYEYKNSSAQSIPGKIRSMNGKYVAIKGFMFPLESDGERLTTFMLVKDQASCCFGGTPKVNHWIYVQMERDKKADYVDSIPVTVFGKLSIGESTVEGMKGLYCMKADRVWAPHVNENRIVDN